MNTERLRHLYKNVVNFPRQLLKPKVADLAIDEELITAQLQDESNLLLRKLYIDPGYWSEINRILGTDFNPDEDILYKAVRAGKTVKTDVLKKVIQSRENIYRIGVNDNYSGVHIILDFINVGQLIFPLAAKIPRLGKLLFIPVFDGKSAEITEPIEIRHRLNQLSLVDDASYLLDRTDHNKEGSLSWVKFDNVLSNKDKESFMFFTINRLNFQHSTSAGGLYLSLVEDDRKRKYINS
ncbi:hypothetical protein HYT02_01930 [Candidatus Gottesmanbacteria bacterium]|nr:hypothetical protein [Candidatus Gottesmanbacteria bacterium]